MHFDSTLHFADVIAMLGPALVLWGFHAQRMQRIEECIDRAALSLENLRVRMDMVEERIKWTL